MADDRDATTVPPHLRGLPTLDDAAFILGGLSNDELRDLPIAVTNLQLELGIEDTPD